MKNNILFTIILVLLFSISCDLYEDIFNDKEDEPATVADVEGNVYATVKIGSQIWMAENLKTFDK